MMENMIFAYDWLIKSIISKYTYYFDRDDLYQVGVIGLINAYKKFDKNSKTEFSTYAYFWIMGEVKKFIRESNAFKVSKDLAKLNKSLEKAKESLTQVLGRVPSDLEIANYLEIPKEKLDEARYANQLVASLDYENDDLDLYDRIGYKETSYEADILDLKDEVATLPLFEKKLIKERYENGLTQGEASKVLGISQVQVCRKEKKILERLRTRLE